MNKNHYLPSYSNASRLLLMPLLCLLFISFKQSDAADQGLVVPVSKNEVASDWFEVFKSEATDEQLYRFLYAMPKGGDLHNHMSGSALIEWFYEMALEQEANGYIYYTRVKVSNCHPIDAARAPLLLLNLQQSNYQKLSACERSEFKRLQDLNDDEKVAWFNSMRLDKPHEGRDEFFSAHWQRMNDI